MDVYTLDQLDRLKRPTIFLLGVFDGVHLGHQYLLSCASALSRAKGMPTAALALSISPQAIMAGCGEQSVLTPPSHKKDLLEEHGLSILIETTFTAEMQAMSARSFLELLEHKCLIDTWVVGSDVGFGKDRGGNRLFLEEYVAIREQSALFIERRCFQGEPISSTSVRESLSQGDIERVSQLLGRSYTFRASVTTSEKTPYGQTLFHLDRSNMCLPKDGLWRAQIVGKSGDALLYIQGESCLLLTQIKGEDSIEVMPKSYVRSVYGSWKELLAEEKALCC